MRLGEDSRYWLNCSAIERDLGWRQQIELEQGLQEMVAWEKKYLNELKKLSADFVLRG
jgi:dTDP-glucose 4,6-dehydratase